MRESESPIIEVLLKLAEKDRTAERVAWAFLNNFDRLPEEVRDELFTKLAGKDRAAERIAKYVAENFNELPEEVRNLLFPLAEKDEAAKYVADAVVDNFNLFGRLINEEEIKRRLEYCFLKITYNQQ